MYVCLLTAQIHQVYCSAERQIWIDGCCPVTVVSLCDPVDSSTPGLPVLHHLPEPAQTHVHRVRDAIHPLVLCCPFLLLSSIFPTVRVFSSESVLHIRWPKCWSFDFSISPSNEYSGLISFRMDWLDLLAVQGTLKSLLQHHSSKASVLRCSAFFMVQLSHPYMTIEKTIYLTRWIFVGKVLSLLVQVCYNFSSKEQVSFKFMAAVTICSDFGDQEFKPVTVSISFPHLVPSLHGK